MSENVLVLSVDVAPQTLTLDPLALLGVLLAIDGSPLPTPLRLAAERLAATIVAVMDPQLAEGLAMLRDCQRQKRRMSFYARSLN